MKAVVVVNRKGSLSKKVHAARPEDLQQMDGVHGPHLGKTLCGYAVDGDFTVLQVMTGAFVDCKTCLSRRKGAP